MNWSALGFIAAGLLTLSNPSYAQTQTQTQAPAPAKASLVPQGVSADRGALTPMDYIEIQQLYARHSIALDMADGDARGKLFAPEGSYANLDSHHRARPRDELIRDTNRNGNLGQRHLVTNLVITPTKEGADGFAYLAMVDLKGQVHTGFYNDKLVKTAEGWKFAARVGWYDADPDSPYLTREQADAVIAKRAK